VRCSPRAGTSEGVAAGKALADFLFLKNSNGNPTIFLKNEMLT
jgi:hypothetical protein